MEVEGRSSSPVIMTVFTLFFGLVAAFIYYGFWKICKEGDFLEAVIRAGFPLIFALFFTYLVLYYLFLLIKPPTWHKAELIKKEFFENRGGGEYYMVFKSPAMYLNVHCTTTKENNFQRGQEYKILVKEFTNRVYKVDYLTDQDSKKKKRNVSLRPIYFTAIVIVIFTALFPLGSNVISLLSLNKNLLPALLPFILFGIIFVISSIKGLTALIKISKKDENPYSKVACGRGPNRGMESLPSGMGNGDKFFIKRVIYEISIGEVYQILNSNGDKILEAKLDLSRFRTYSVKNNYDESIATIHYSDLSTTMGKYEVQIGHEEPFYVRNMVTMDAAYEITGLDYYTKGDITRREYRILDLNKNTVADINGKELENGWMDANESQVTMASGVENNIYILLLALTIFISKEKLGK